MTDDAGETGADARRLRPRRLRDGDSGEKQGFIERVSTNMPLLFPGKPPSDLHEQVQLLLELRASRLRRFLVRAAMFVILPSLLVLFYTTVIATPRYVCTFQETYQINQASTSLASAVTQSITMSTDAVDYGSVIVEYITSAALAQKLEKQLHLRAHFSDPKIDWTSRLSKDATDAQYLNYLSKRISVSEGFGGYITVSVEAFDPAMTLRLAQAINDDADDMLDSMTVGARSNGVKAATDQLHTATTALNTANDALTQYRNVHGDLDPSLIATEIATIEGTLDSQLASLRAQLAQAQANLQPNSSQIVQLNLQVAAVEQQITAERQRLADNTGKTTYSNTVAEYENLLSNQQLATTTFQAAQQGLVIANANASDKQNYVVDFVEPVLPDKPTEPDPLKSTALAFLICLLAYGIVNLLFTALRDQAGI